MTPTEPYSSKPKVWTPEIESDWDGLLTIEDGVGELRGVRVANELPVDDFVELHLIDCELDNVSFADVQGVELHIERSTLSTCDLGRAKIHALISSEIASSKLHGTDLSSSEITDVIFRGSTFRYLSVRMARLARVAFIDDDLSEIDFYNSDVTDVSFDRSRLADVHIDACTLERVDFRGAERLGLVSTNSMKGSLISEGQVIEMAYQFAISSGVDIDSPS